MLVVAGDPQQYHELSAHNNPAARAHVVQDSAVTIQKNRGFDQVLPKLVHGSVSVVLAMTSTIRISAATTTARSYYNRETTARIARTVQASSLI